MRNDRRDRRRVRTRWPSASAQYHFRIGRPARPRQVPDRVHRHARPGDRFSGPRSDRLPEAGHRRPAKSASSDCAWRRRPSRSPPKRSAWPRAISNRSKSCRPSPAQPRSSAPRPRERLHSTIRAQPLPLASSRRAFAMARSRLSKNMRRESRSAGSWPESYSASRPSIRPRRGCFQTAATREELEAFIIGFWAFEPMLFAIWAALGPGRFVIRTPLIILVSGARRSRPGA